MKKFKAVASVAARKAGDYLLKEFRNYQRPPVVKKTHHEILTKFDTQAEKIILRLIKKNFPEHSVLSEEAGQETKKSDYLWAVDPLDGTTNFSMYNPIWSVSIGLFYRHEPILGVIYAPVIKGLWLAEKGRGIHLNQRKAKVSLNGQLENSILTFCHGSTDEAVARSVKLFDYFKIKALAMRQLGSAAWEFSLVAMGGTEAIMIPGARVWDVAAGALMVREAGGRVTDFLGKEWDLTSPDILASNGAIHNQLLVEIKKILS